jgi:hypothetical protein
MAVRPGGFAAAEHVHPDQDEHFQIASGQITLRVGGRERIYTAGEDVTIPVGTPHVCWNSGHDDLRVVLDFRPAGRFAEFITTFFALACGQDDQRRLAEEPVATGRDVWRVPEGHLRLGLRVARLGRVRGVRLCARET